MELPNKTSTFQIFFSAVLSYTAYKAENVTRKFSVGKIVRRFATKLHAYAHLHSTDMELECMCGRVSIPVLKQELHTVYDLRTPCKRDGTPLSSKKIYLSKILSELNTHVQVYFFFIVGIDENAILKIMYTHSTYSDTVPLPSKETEQIAKTFD